MWAYVDAHRTHICINRRVVRCIHTPHNLKAKRVTDQS